MKWKTTITTLGFLTTVSGATLAGAYYNKEIKQSLTHILPARYSEYFERTSATQPAPQPILAPKPTPPPIDYEKIINQKVNQAVEEKIKQAYGKLEQTIDQKVNHRIEENVNYRINALELKVNTPSSSVTLPASATPTQENKRETGNRFSQAYDETIDVIKKRIAQPYLKDIVESADKTIDQHLQPTDAAQRAYNITLKNIDNFTITQLLNLEQKIREKEQKALSTQEYSQHASAYCQQSIPILNQTQLLSITRISLPKLSEENYTIIIKEKPLEFWLGNLNKSYGVQFSSPDKGGN